MQLFELMNHEGSGGGNEDFIPLLEELIANSSKIFHLAEKGDWDTNRAMQFFSKMESLWKSVGGMVDVPKYDPKRNMSLGYNPHDISSVSSFMESLKGQIETDNVEQVMNTTSEINMALFNTFEKELEDYRQDGWKKYK